MDNPKCGESLSIIVGVRGTSRIVSTPLPKQDGNPQAAFTDFLSVTFPLNFDARSSIFQLLFNCLGRDFGPALKRSGGLHGYTESFILGETKAIFAYGGQSGTAFLSLTGESCALISDWLRFVNLFKDGLKGRITRWDGAVDVYDGIPSVDDARTLYEAGKFNAGGRKPLCSNSGNWTDSDDEKGRTFYVGSRKNGKLIRIYEKGKQLGDPESL